MPLRVFAYLQGIDGNNKKFTIQGVNNKLYYYPKSHTCFNRMLAYRLYTFILRNLALVVCMGIS